MYRAVLVEDEFWTLEGIFRTFPWIDWGFEVIAKTTDPEEALNIIIKDNPDAVFTDIIMPEMTGLELIKAVRENERDTEFVIISGYDEFAYAREAVKLGAFDYCLKPVKDSDANELLGRLYKRLEGKEKKNGEQELSGVKTIQDLPFETDDKINCEEFKELLQYVHENFTQRIYLQELAQKFYLNPNYCCDLFKKVTGKTFSEYVTILRMKKAAEFLKDGRYTIADVALKSGYSDYYYFNKVFKKEYGCTPVQYRKKDKGTKCEM